MIKYTLRQQGFDGCYDPALLCGALAISFRISQSDNTAVTPMQDLCTSNAYRPRCYAALHGRHMDVLMYCGMLLYVCPTNRQVQQVL